MSEKINLRMALRKQADLTTPTEEQVYPLGLIVETTNDDTKTVKKFKYVKSHDALTAYVPYSVNPAATSGAEVITAAPATTVGAVVEIGVPQVAFTSGYYGFVQIEGNATAVITGSTGNTAGTAMQVTNGAAALIAITTGVATPTINSCAYLVTSTSGVSGSVYLGGNRVEITT